MHLNSLVEEAQLRMNELSAKIQNEGLGVDSTDKEKQLKSWEWRYRLYKRMKTGYEYARKYATFHNNLLKSFFFFFDQFIPNAWIACLFFLHG